jgi:hypothetical protein
VAIDTPALGPSLGIAPSGTWMCTSISWKKFFLSGSTRAMLRA